MEVEGKFVLNVTPSAMSILALADRFAKQRGHKAISSEHVALGVVAADGSLGATALKELGVSVESLGSTIEMLVEKG